MSSSSSSRSWPMITQVSLHMQQGKNKVLELTCIFSFILLLLTIIEESQLAGRKSLCGHYQRATPRNSGV